MAQLPLLIKHHLKFSIRIRGEYRIGHQGRSNKLNSACSSLLLSHFRDPKSDQGLCAWHVDISVSEFAPRVSDNLSITYRWQDCAVVCLHWRWECPMTAAEQWDVNVLNNLYLYDFSMFRGTQNCLWPNVIPKYVSFLMPQVLGGHKLC